MTRNVSSNKKGISFTGLFTQYISDIILEVEGIKVKSMRDDIQGINAHIARINSALLGIMDAKLDLAEKYSDTSNFSKNAKKLSEHTERSDKYEIIPTGNIHDKKTKIGLAIKETLLEFGKPTYEKVVEYLYQEYNCVLTDCYEHPEYLKAILQKIFGNAHMVIVESIKTHLEFDEQKSIQEFLTVIAR